MINLLAIADLTLRQRLQMLDWKASCITDGSIRHRISLARVSVCEGALLDTGRSDTREDGVGEWKPIQVVCRGYIRWWVKSILNQVVTYHKGHCLSDTVLRPDRRHSGSS